MQFIHQGLAWGLLLVAVPVLIHLINLLRHRRVKWAAMEFLLQSYQKNRKWVWLRQFLLLLLHMAAVALAVVMLAQWVSRDEWFNFVGGKETHHYIILDDSLSMAEHREVQRHSIWECKRLVIWQVERCNRKLDSALRCFGSHARAG